MAKKSKFTAGSATLPLPDEDDNSALPEELRELRMFSRRLNGDLRKAAATLERDEARYLVDTYYQIQEDRKSHKNRERAAAEDQEPNLFMSWVGGRYVELEAKIKMAMKAYANQSHTGRWTLGLFGFGEVFAGGLIAYLDITRAPNAGSLWRFCGVDGKVEWKSSAKAERIVKENVKRKKPTQAEADKIAIKIGIKPQQLQQRMRFLLQDEGEGEIRLTRELLRKAVAMRPWNARAKVLIWKIGDRIRVFSNKKKSYYGPLYREYKARLVVRNEAGDFSDQAAQTLKDVPNHKQKKILAEGQLPPGQIEARALRWVGKLFLSHWHEVAYYDHYGQVAPKPYALAHLNHAHYIPPAPSDFTRKKVDREWWEGYLAARKDVWKTVS